MAKKKAVPELSAAEIRRRLDAVRDSVASTTIEGGSVTPETEALLVEWAHEVADCARAASGHAAAVPAIGPRNWRRFMRSPIGGAGRRHVVNETLEVARTHLLQIVAQSTSGACGDL